MMECEAPLAPQPLPVSSWCLIQRSRKRALPGQAISQKMSLTSAPPDVMDRPPSSNRNAESHRSTTPAPTASWSARACVTRKPLAATELPAWYTVRRPPSALVPGVTSPSQPRAASEIVSCLPLLMPKIQLFAPSLSCSPHLTG